MADLTRRSALALTAMTGAVLSSSAKSKSQDAIRRSSVSEITPQDAPLPPDDLNRALTLARPESDQMLPHIGLVGRYLHHYRFGQRDGWSLLRYRHAHPAGRRSSTASS